MKRIIRDPLQAIIAGIYIGIGCMVFMRTSSLALGAFLFSFGPMVCHLFDLPLFNIRVHALVSKSRDSVIPMIGELTLVWFGNYIGCYLLREASRYISGLDSISGYCREFIDTRLAMNPIKLFILAMGCNIVIYAATKAFEKYDGITGSVVIIGASMTCIYCGFEHAVAISFIAICCPSDPLERLYMFVPIILGNWIGAVLPALIFERFAPIYENGESNGN